MAERKFVLNNPMNKSNIGSVGDELRKVEAKKDHDFRIIPKEKIIPNPINDYPMENIERLMERIGSGELIHNLRVKPEGENFLIISGERRYRALCMGIERKDPRFDKYILGFPCMVSDRNLNDVDTEIELILANEEVREEDDSRKRKKVQRLNELYALKNKENGESKSIIKQVSESLGMGERTVQRINAVNNKLIPKLQEAFDNAKIDLKRAATFAAMDEVTQNMIAELFEESNSLTKNEIDTITQKAKENEEKIKREAKSEAQRLENENRELSLKIKKAEDDQKENERCIKKLQEDLEKEKNSVTPDQEAIIKLENTILELQINTENQKKENELIVKKLSEKEKDMKRLQENKQEISPEEKEKLKAQIELNSVMEEIMIRLNKLTSLGKKYSDKYKEKIDDIRSFQENASKTLSELQKLSK